jgi:hypothetical protein
MKSISIAMLLTLITGCSTPHPAATQPLAPVASQAVTSFFDPDTTIGPTVMSKVDGGYQLINRRFRVVISDQTGDVIFWGYVDQARNTVFHRGIFTSLTGLPDAPIHGYIEKRDDQTWQFYGDDDNHITWRKIYCLEGDSLLVSILITNNRPGPDPLVTAIQIKGDLISLNIAHHDPELFTGRGGYGGVTLQGFNEYPAPTSQPALPTLIQSDTFHLKPQERQGYTSQWKLVP